MSDLVGFTKALAIETREFVSGTLEKALGGIRESLAGIAGRLDALEARMGAIRNGEKGEQGAPGRDGRDAEPLDPAVIAQRAADLIPRPRDGRDADLLAVKGLIAADLAGMVREEAARLFATIQAPKDGRDGKDADPVFVKSLVTAALAEQPPRSAWIQSPDPAEMQQAISAEVTKQVSALPECVKAEIARQLSALPQAKDGRDGVGVKGLLINRDGHLVATYTDGSTMDAGTVVGRDGKDADPDVLAKMIADGFERMPRPKDGADGADGLGIDDADLVFLEKAGFVLRLQHGSGRTKDLPLPIPFFADVFRIGEHYKKGAIVIHRGVWIATADTRERPGDGATAWRLIAKNGRDGRDRGGDGGS